MAKEKKNHWKTISIISVALIILIIAVSLASLYDQTKHLGRQPVVAVIPLKGPIVTQSAGGLFASQEASSESILETLEQIKQDGRVDAVIIHINSPGGYVVPSHKIAKAISELDIPTVALVEDAAASGAYWVASATDHIIVDDFSMTGSIGVIASYLNFAGLLDDFNVTYERLVAGQYKDMGIPFRNLTSDERAVFQQQLDDLHTSFVAAVANNRNLSEQHVRTLATGQVFLGTKAVELGLADELGGRREAEQYLLERLGASSLKYVSYERSPSFFASLFSAKTVTPFDLINSDPLPQFR